MMKFWAFALANVSVALLGSTASAAQSGQTASDQKNVNEYLCTFAGKCGSDTAAATAPTIAAPATKGFRLAAPQAGTPTQAAPPTKGFRLAAPQAASANTPATAAPATKGFRLAHGGTVTPATARPARRTQVAMVRPSPAGGTRANLMLNFEYNSDEMTTAARGKATVFAQAMMSPELKDKRFMIEGHTDARGSRDVNIDLSRRRAQAVADFLVKQGVDSSRVEVKGVGPDAPLAGHAAAAEANRRVEAVLLS